MTLTVVETEGFAKDARKIFTDEELGELHHHLGTFRELGVVIPGTGGLRKVRWGASGKGKRGGARVIYYYGGDHMPIFMIAIYRKSEQADMTAVEKRMAIKLVGALREEWKQETQAKAPRLRAVKGHGTRR